MAEVGQAEVSHTDIGQVAEFLGVAAGEVFGVVGRIGEWFVGRPEEVRMEGEGGATRFTYVPEDY